MEDILVDKNLNHHQIKFALKEIFPKLEAFEYIIDPSKKLQDPEGFSKDNKYHILFTTKLYKPRPQFPLTITIYRTADLNSEERGLYLAEKFSDLFDIKTYSKFTLRSSPNDPYYGILFDNKISYLADDSEFDDEDEKSGSIKIIKQYVLPDYRFDDEGSLIIE